MEAEDGGHRSAFLPNCTVRGHGDHTWGSAAAAGEEDDLELQRMLWKAEAGKRLREKQEERQ